MSAIRLVNECDVSKLVRLYQAMKGIGIVDKTGSSVLTLNREDCVIEVRFPDNVSVVQSSIPYLNLRGVWPDLDGKLACRVDLSVLLDVPYTMWRFCYLYLGDVFQWVNNDGTLGIWGNLGVVDTDFCNFAKSVIPLKGGWAKCIVPNSVRDQLFVLSKDLHMGSKLGTIGELFMMAEGTPAFRFLAYSKDSKVFPYSTNMPKLLLDGMTEIVSILGRSNVDISRLVWYMNGSYSRGYRRKLPGDEYELIIA